MPANKPIDIKQFICSGELDEPANTQDMLEQAGRLLDKAGSHEICGEVLFRDDKGHFHVGTVEFVIGRANPSYVVDTLANTYAECSMCGHIERSDDLGELSNEDNPKAAGICTECSGVSYEIDKSRAIVLAGAAKLPAGKK